MSRPGSGPHLFFDMLAIPADAPNPEAAHAFIDFLLRPEVMAAVTSHVRYPNAVPDEPAAGGPGGARRPERLSARRGARRGLRPRHPAARGRAPRSRLWSRFRAGR